MIESLIGIAFISLLLFVKLFVIQVLVLLASLL